MELNENEDYKSTFVNQEPRSKNVTRTAGKRYKKKSRKTRRSLLKRRKIS
jgi:hypothetical protein